MSIHVKSQIASHRPWLRIRIALLATGAAWLGLSAGCAPPPGAPPLPAETSLAVALQAPSALAIVAGEKSLFTREALSVRIHECTSGKLALQTLRDKKVDFATTADVPAALAMCEDGEFLILAQIASDPESAILAAKRGNGIETQADLRGKRIGTQKGSAVHFFLHLFLAKYGMKDSEVVMCFLPIEELPAALAEDRIDACTLREPFLSQADQQLGKDSLVRFSEKNLYIRAEVLVARPDILAGKPDLARRLLRVLLSAEDYVKTHPAEAAQIVAAKLRLPAAPGVDLLAGKSFHVNLTQTLLSCLDEEMRWALETGVVPASHFPNSLKFIAPDPLHEVQSGRMSMIR